MAQLATWPFRHVAAVTCSAGVHAEADVGGGVFHAARGPVPFRIGGQRIADRHHRRVAAKRRTGLDGAGTEVLLHGVVCGARAIRWPACRRLSEGPPDELDDRRQDRRCDGAAVRVAAAAGIRRRGPRRCGVCAGQIWPGHRTGSAAPPRRRQCLARGVGDRCGAEWHCARRHPGKPLAARLGQASPGHAVPAVIGCQILASWAFHSPCC